MASTPEVEPGDPAVRPVEIPTRDARPAAVLCALFEEDGQAMVILTRRSNQLRSHTGQVSFPGGRIDPGEGPEAAALRESFEEIGLPPSEVTLIGSLQPLATLTSQSAITPLVGVLPGRPVLVPNPAEVERAFAVPLVELASAEVYHEELWQGSGRGEHAVHFFELAGDTVWGATARLLRELLDRVLPAGPPTQGSPAR